MKWRSRAIYADQGVASAERHLVAAYSDTFGKANEAAEMVLSDLAAFTGFYQVAPPGDDPSLYQAGYRDGLRAAFGRLFQFLSLSDDQLRALEEAARREAGASNEDFI